MTSTPKQLILMISEKLKHLYEDREAKSIASRYLEDAWNVSVTDQLINKTLHFSNENKLTQDISKLASGTPLQYVLGKTSFYGLPFLVNPNVLIPRQETEELVHWILNSTPALEKLDLIDLGTGSGCIPVSIKKERPAFNVSAADISEEALTVARENAKINNVNVHLIQIDILSNQINRFFDNSLDIIVSNPPYVRLKEKSMMGNNVLEHEPELALFVEDSDPLIFYREILKKGNHWLKPGGSVYFEINEALGKEMVNLCNQYEYTSVDLRKDLNGKDRMIRAIKKETLL